jgi:integrase
MFKKFIQWQYLKESPYNGVINVKFEKLNKIQTLNENEQELLLKKAKYTYKNVYPLIQIILNTGLKKSEILALKKEDINFENRKIYVYKTVFENTILKTKFKSAIREVDIPENLINLFKELTKKKEDYLFLKSGSSFITVDKIIRKEFSALLIHAKIQKIAFKELRHTFARNSLQKGISIDYLHKQLGEYSIQATMDKYREFITK